MSILLVDDSRATIMILETMLQKNGFLCVSVQHGREAIVCLDTFPNIRLVISDIEMPDMSGLELLEIIKARPELQAIPLLFLSGKAVPDYVHRAKELGCVGFMVKPFSEQDLINKVNTILKEEPDTLKESSLVMNMLGFSKNAYKGVLSSFREEVLEAMKLIEDNVGTQEPKRVVSAVEKLRDGAKIMGAERLLRVFDRWDDTKGQDVEGQIVSVSPSFLRECKAIIELLSDREESASP